jgi:hypothetical protein
LLAGRSDELIADNFEHEQNLVITENGKTILIPAAPSGNHKHSQKFQEAKAKNAGLCGRGFSFVGGRRG